MSKFSVLSILILQSGMAPWDCFSKYYPLSWVNMGASLGFEAFQYCVYTCPGSIHSAFMETQPSPVPAVQGPKVAKTAPRNGSFVGCWSVKTRESTTTWPGVHILRVQSESSMPKAIFSTSESCAVLIKGQNGCQDNMNYLSHPCNIQYNSSIQEEQVCKEPQLQVLLGYVIHIQTPDRLSRGSISNMRQFTPCHTSISWIWWPSAAYWVPFCCLCCQRQG